MDIIALIKRIINKIWLAITKIYARMIGRKVEKVYKSEPVGLKYVHVEDLTEDKLKELSGKSVKKSCVLFSETKEDPDPIELKTFYSHKDALASIVGVVGDEVRKVESPSIHPVRNRINGRIVMVRGTAESIKMQYGEDYEVVESYIKE